TYATSGSYTVHTTVTELELGATPLVLTSTATVAAQFQFATATYNTVSDPTFVTLTVNRIGGTGSQSVEIYTTDGTAHTGTDYTQTGTQGGPGSGVLVQFTGSQTSQTVQVPILLFTGTPYAGTRSFTVTLENPNGTNTLGTPSTATVNITDPQLAVGSVTATSSGYVVQFNRQFNATLPHLYVTTTSGTTPTSASAQLSRTGTDVAGSLVFDNTDLTKATFVATNANTLFL